MLKLHRLKQGLRELVLSKRLKPETDVKALIEKRPPGSRPRKRRQLSHPSGDAVDDEGLGSSSEDSVIGTTTRRRAHSRSSFAAVELRLYRRTESELSGVTGPTIACGSMLLPPECKTSDDCFDRVRKQLSVDCSVLVFELPADMSYEDQVRVDRKMGEAAFQKIRDIFEKANAKRYPGEPQYHSVEVLVEG